jgi:hypothetical protein
VLSVTPRPLYPRKWTRYPLWAPGPAWTGVGNLAFTGVRFPDLPARIDSPYRLRCRGQFIYLYSTYHNEVTNFKINRYLIQDRCSSVPVVFVQYIKWHGLRKSALHVRVVEEQLRILTVLTAARSRLSDRCWFQVCTLSVTHRKDVITVKHKISEDNLMGFELRLFD